MLELKGVRVTYGDVEVVHGVDLEVREGEAVGMIGPNGAGKSSILRAICGLRRPSAGAVRFAGEEVGGRPPEEIARRGLALVPEGRQIFGTLSVAENLRLGARGGGVELEALLRRFPLLRDRGDQRAGLLSGGEQQQLALARALAGGPKLLMLDEPSLGLAPKMINKIYELLAALREEGLAMLLVEQNATRTIDFSDRCVVLGGGEVRAEGSKVELQRSPELLRTYLGKQL